LLAALLKDFQDADNLDEQKYEMRVMAFFSLLHISVVR
jgi:hypothetical protein